ncbi:hypothetical protein VOI32_03100 [Paraburkholderia caribensis]|uniref:Uncharacterized protein n=1 Tax=Paraburkholderia caribensis TaxID=75105 RepID=A0ABV0DTI3_9BURK|nr:hypothetical protein [Paraburkholderia caribensis]
MTKKLVLVDHQNKQKVVLSLMDESFGAAIFSRLFGYGSNTATVTRMPAVVHPRHLRI